MFQKKNLYQVNCEIPGSKVSIGQLLSQSYHRIDTLEDFQFDFINIYHVTYFKENSHQKYSLEFWLPKYYALWALSNDGGDDIPLLNQRGLIIGKSKVSAS